MRLFIAIRLSDNMRDALVSVQQHLREKGVRGTYTKPENLHITLAFLGEYPDPEAILDLMRTVSFSSFPLRLEGFGSFGDLYWCGLGGSDALHRCATRLRRVLAENGIPYDRKRFSPHITLIRRGRVENGSGFPGVTVPEAGMEVQAVSLMRSDRGKNGMIYTELGRIGAG